MIAKTAPATSARLMPTELAEVALIDAATSAAAGDMSLSWWHAAVAAGRAPAPAVRKSRCTRWKLADVRAFWVKFAEAAPDGEEVAAMVTARATKASRAAQAKRAAAALVE